MSDGFYLLHEGVQKAIWRLGWKSLRPIQNTSIETLYNTDNDFIVSARTAGGKTEAAFLPVLSKLAEDRTAQAIYVGPLKALINDQFGRLEQLCGDVEIPVHRWHGDVTATEKKKFRQNPCGVLLITPESLESNFINYGNALERLYSGLRYVVIDELHDFIPSVRGIHLRSLLSRLRTASKTDPRMIGLSATLSTPEAGQRFLRPSNPDRVKIISDPERIDNTTFELHSVLIRPPGADENEQRLKRLAPGDARKFVEDATGECWEEKTPLAGECVGIYEDSPDHPGDAPEDLVKHLKKDYRQGTNLIFANTRSLLERLGNMISETAETERWPTNPFVLHHSSIDRAIRLEIETRLKDGVPTSVLCSSTMELGMDVGSVRAVAQVDAPFRVASLIQRFGRAGRREGVTAIARMFCRDKAPTPMSGIHELICPNLLRGMAIMELAEQRRIEPIDPDRLHLSTLVHQIISLLKETSGATAARLFNTLCQQGPFTRVDPPLFTKLLRALGAKKVIEQAADGDLILSEVGEKLVFDRSFYAAFKAGDLFRIQHGNNSVGSVPRESVPEPGETFVLGGSAWMVLDIRESDKVVVVDRSKEGSDTKFIGDSGEMHQLVGAQMLEILRDDHIPKFMTPESANVLSYARHAAKQSGASKSGIVCCGEYSRFYPWKGTRVIKTLEAFAEVALLDYDSDTISIAIPLVRNQFREFLKIVTSYTGNGEDLSALLKVKTFDRFDDLLPDEIINFANARDRLDIAGAQEAARAALKGYIHAHS